MKNKKPHFTVADLQKLTLERKYQLGTRFMDEKRQVFKYGKLDFGILAKDQKTKKIYRNVVYGWFRVK